MSDKDKQAFMNDRNNSHTGFNRREFLALSRQFVLGAGVLTLLPFSLKASDVNSLELIHLDTSTGLLLARLGRLLFPHDRLEDNIYLEVVRDVDRDIDRDPDLKDLVMSIEPALNDNTGPKFVDMPLQKQLEKLTSIQGSPVFAYLHNRTLESLYRNPVVWKMIGYQGSSIEYGGYLHRGFDDIDWLDKP